MDSTRPATYHEAIEQYQAQYSSAIELGIKSPFILPRALFGYVLLFLYLLILPTRYRAFRLLRYGVFSLIVWHSISTMRCARTISMSYGLGVGLCSSWCILWSATFLIFTEPHKNFSRIQRSRSSVNLASIGPKHNENTSTNTSSAAESKNVTTTYARRAPLVWQSMPEGIWQRLDWTFDLLTSLRGLNWTWKPSEKSPPPGEIVARYQSPSRGTLWSSLSRTLLFSFSLDIIKVAMMKDPYFWGLAEYSWRWTSSVPLLDLVFMSICRPVLSFAGIYIAVLWAYSLVPLVCVHVLGPKLIGVRGEEWMYPAVNGKFSEVIHGGLQGFWGKWWHQLIHLPFVAAGSWTIYHTRLIKRSSLAWLLRLVVAFAMSGFVHACACYTLWPDTRSWRPFLFFMIQPVGIACQKYVAHLLERHRTTIRFSKTTRYTANMFFTIFWLWFTFPLLADEYTRGGVWLAEPLPISPLRAWGAISGERFWWCWHGQWGKWHTGDTWWQSGLAIN